ncbi:MAG: hypothetical protein WBE08_01450 [Methyloceanibacter sp.]|jgi:hypothetical protein
MTGRPPHDTRPEGADARRKRLAEELRANLLRRKSQARARRAAAPMAGEGEKTKGEKA